MYTIIKVKISKLFGNVVLLKRGLKRQITEFEMMASEFEMIPSEFQILKMYIFFQLTFEE